MQKNINTLEVRSNLLLMELPEKAKKKQIKINYDQNSSLFKKS